MKTLFRLIPLLYLSLLFGSCHGSATKKTTKVELDTRIVADFLTGKTPRIPTEAENRLLDSIIRASRRQNDTLTLIYTLDSGCSVCIAEFLYFVQLLQTLESDIPVIALLPDENNLVVEHYMNLVGISGTRPPVSFVENATGETFRFLREKTTLCRYDPARNGYRIGQTVVPRP